MKGYVQGKDVTGMPFWGIMPTHDGLIWLGTGHDILFVQFPSLREALDFFIGHYPDTDHIDSTLDNQYHHSDVGKAKRKPILDSIMNDINKEKNHGSQSEDVQA